MLSDRWQAIIWTDDCSLDQNRLIFIQENAYENVVFIEASVCYYHQLHHWHLQTGHNNNLIPWQKPFIMQWFIGNMSHDWCENSGAGTTLSTYIIGV